MVDLEQPESAIVNRQSMRTTTGNLQHSYSHQGGSKDKTAEHNWAVVYNIESPHIMSDPTAYYNNETNSAGATANATQSINAATNAAVVMNSPISAIVRQSFTRTRPRASP